MYLAPRYYPGVPGVPQVRDAHPLPREVKESMIHQISSPSSIVPWSSSAYVLVLSAVDRGYDGHPDWCRSLSGSRVMSP